MLISRARAAYLNRFLVSLTFALVAAALLLLLAPLRSDARPLPSGAVRVAATRTPPDERLFSASPSAPDAAAASHAASASDAATRLGIAAAVAGLDAAQAARSRVVDRVAGGGLMLDRVLQAEETVPERAVRAERRAVSPAPARRPVSRTRSYARVAVSSRGLFAGRLFNRSSAAATSRMILAGRSFSSDDSRDSGGRAEIVRTALTYRGTPYRFGGRGRGGFDCSGFTGRVFAQTGTPLPRTAAAQFGRGVAVDRGQLQQGDLVFFKNTYRRGVSHVGIYVGEGKFVHASSSRGVRVDSLGSSYFARRWAGARRAAAPQTRRASLPGQVPVLRRG